MFCDLLTKDPKSFKGCPRTTQKPRKEQNDMGLLEGKKGLVFGVANDHKTGAQTGEPIVQPNSELRLPHVFVKCSHNQNLPRGS